MSIIRTIKAVGAGVMDYSKKSKQANMDAESNLKSSFGNSGQANDVSRVATETAKLKKERKVSLRNSIRSKLEI